jgi:hypothetical protein
MGRPFFYFRNTRSHLINASGRQAWQNYFRIADNTTLLNASASFSANPFSFQTPTL